MIIRLVLCLPHNTHPLTLPPLSTYVDGWGNGGSCSNYQAIMSFTKSGGTHHSWVRAGVFGWNPHHQFTGYHCWWWWCWSYNYQHCQLYSGGDVMAIYACRL